MKMLKSRQDENIDNQKYVEKLDFEKKYWTF